MNQAPISPNLNRSWEESQQIIKNLEAEIIRLKAQQAVKSCQCHTIDANKVSVLMWVEKGSIQTKCSCSCHTQNFILKIAQQKLRGLIRTDKYKATYWKFKNLEESLELTQVKPKTSKCSNCQAEIEANSKSTLCYTCSQKEIRDKLAARKAEITQNQAQKAETQETIKESHANQ